MGLGAEQGKTLALATFAGATGAGAASDESPQVLRERVTSKGGTTHAALASLEADGVKAAFVKALKAAQQRARELGDAFGRVHQPALSASSRGPTMSSGSGKTIVEFLSAAMTVSVSR
jgi:hypothetical protein